MNNQEPTKDEDFIFDSIASADYDLLDYIVASGFNLNQNLKIRLLFDDNPEIRQKAYYILDEDYRNYKI